MDGEKRVRKKSKRLSEQDKMGERGKRGGRRRKSVEAEEVAKKPKGKKAAGKESLRKKECLKELLVSYAFASGTLTLSGVPMSELAESKRPKLIVTSSHRGSALRDSSGLGGGGGDGAFPRRTMETKFKNPKFSFSYFASNKKKTWKNFKQILVADRSQTWRPDDPTYSSIDAPPPLRPPKKYSDLSGAVAKYTDPRTGMMYSTAEEYQQIRSLPPNVVQGYLALRGKAGIT